MLRFLIIIAICAELAVHSSAQQFQVVDLGVLPSGSESRAWDINDHGQVVGISSAGSSVSAFVHDPSSGMAPVGVLPGQTNSSARAINNAGQIVGSSWAAPITQPGTAYLYSPATGVTSLGILPGGTTSEAFDVSDGGAIVGQAQGNGFSPEPVMVAPAGVMIPLTSSAMAGNAYAVNDWGLVAGEANDQARLWHPLTGMQTLPAPGGLPRARAQAVNRLGDAAGTIRDPSNTIRHLAKWSNGVLTDLGIMGRYSHVQDMNDAGWIVGFDQFSFSVPSTGLLYTPTGGLQDVNTLLAPSSAGWTITSVFGVNALGQMAANGVDVNGARRAVRLDPVTPSGAVSAIIGTSCGSNPGFTFDATPPSIAGGMRLTALGAYPGGAVTVLASPGSPPPLAVGAGCLVRIDPAAFVTVTISPANGAGGWAAFVALDSAPALVGLTATLQAFAPDPAGPLGVAVSNGVAVRFGR